MVTTVDLLRHGEVQGGSYYRGSTDDPLTPNGWQQMQSRVTNHTWDTIYSSSLIRCQAFAKHLGQYLRIPVIIDERLQEIHFGDWEGKTADEIDPKILADFYQNPINKTPPNGESLLDFQTRINQIWTTLLNRHANQKVLVITHAGVIRVLFTLLLDLPLIKMFNIQIDHGRMSQIQTIEDGESLFTSLIFHNK